MKADSRWLEDQVAIPRLIQQVARGFDEKLHDTLLPPCFTADAKIHYYLRGKLIDFSIGNGGIALFKHFHDRCHWTQHLVSPHVVTLDGDAARTATPVHAVHEQVRKDLTRSQWTIAGVYHDELVRTSEGWRIRSRTAVCPYVIGDFLETGVRLYPTLPDFRPPEA